MNEDVITALLKYNNPQYQLNKASEEFQELALVLTQKVNKPYKVSDKEIIDEIGDCKIRLAILERIYNENGEVDKRVAKKLDNFNRYLINKEYENI
jgi:NTP pyrophosphatase (non-canonical NTP hydrolase)